MNIMLILLGLIIASVATKHHGMNESRFLRNLLFNSKETSAPIDLIRDAGYTAEEHTVATEDGYLLTVHRIPNELGSPIFIQHGFMSSSVDWLTLGKRKSLPFLLADLGYDIWLGNYRGNTFSGGHVNLSTSDPQYWDFSWHEMGIYDLPAMINYVTSYKTEKLIYIGHSMGSTGSFVMAAERPDMQDKVQLIISLAPVAYMTHVETPLRFFTHHVTELETIAKISGLNNLLSQDWRINSLMRDFCSSDKLKARLCTSFLFPIFGYDPFQVDYGQLTTIAKFSTAGASTKTLVHYMQEVVSHKFRQYDYGLLMNMKEYGALTPPEYDISKMVIPMAFFYSDNDWLAAVSDVMKFYRQLPNGISVQRVNFTLFNHLDFLWAKEAPKLLYKPMIKLIQSFRRKKKRNIL